MGDHRCSIKIEMEFHGIEDKVDMFINWTTGGEVDDIDDRVIEFIRNVYERGMAVYREDMSKYYAEQNRAETERHEKAVLARLKAKYEAKGESSTDER